jgi:hypothetical protein
VRGSLEDARLVGEKKIERGIGELGRACATTYSGGSARGGPRSGARCGGARGVDGGEEEGGEDDMATKMVATVRVRRL